MRLAAPSLPRKPPEFSRQADARESSLCFASSLGVPVGTQAVGVPLAGQLPTLAECHGAAAGTIPLLAPAIDVRFRPEQQHGSSGEDNIFVPAAGGDGEVYDASFL